MATIQKRGDSYSIRVSCGYDSKGKQVIQSMTWKPEPKMTAKQIEKELSITLFVRSGGKIRPTPEGELVIQYAERVVSLYENLQQALLAYGIGEQVERFLCKT